MGTLNFVTALDQLSDFTIRIKIADTTEPFTTPVSGRDFVFRNITAPDRTPEPENGVLPEISDEDSLNRESVKVESVGDGEWEISSASLDGFTPGHTYQIELLSDRLVFDGLAEFADSSNSVDAVRVYNFSIQKNATLKARLRSDIKFIESDDENIVDTNVMNIMRRSGLFVASADASGGISYTPNNGSGSFTYIGDMTFELGDVVALYDGTMPTNRKPSMTGGSDNGDVTYVKIIAIDGSTYHYVAAEAEDVLFVPDMFPINVDGMENWASGIITLTPAQLEQAKADMGIDASAELEAGDFLGFYEGEFGKTATSPA